MLANVVAPLSEEVSTIPCLLTVSGGNPQAGAVSEQHGAHRAPQQIKTLDEPRASCCLVGAALRSHAPMHRCDPFSQIILREVRLEDS